MTDRIFGGQNLPLVGDTVTGPGVIALKDLLIKTLTGNTLGLKGVALVPTSSDPMRLTDKERENHPGVDCWAVTFKTTAGVMRVGIPR